MKGFVKIEAVTHNGRNGLAVETDLKGISKADFIEMLHALCIALNLGPKDLKIMAAMMESGLADKIADIEVIKDESRSFRDALNSGNWEEFFKSLLN